MSIKPGRIAAIDTFRGFTVKYLIKPILISAIIMLSTTCSNKKEGSYTIQLKEKAYRFQNSYSERVVYSDNNRSDMRFLSGKAGFTENEIGQEDATLYLSIYQQGDGDYEIVDIDELLEGNEARKVAYLVVGIDSSNLETEGSYIPQGGTINVKVINGVYHFSTIKPIIMIREEDEEKATLTIADLYTDNTIK